MADVRPGLQHVKQRQRRQDVLLHKRPQQRREALRVADLILHVVIAIPNREVGCGIMPHETEFNYSVLSAWDSNLTVMRLFFCLHPSCCSHAAERMSNENT